MTILIIIAGIATGILLGLLGSGGSIITIPALIYLLGVNPKSAIAISLGIVAITATVSAIQHFRSGNVNLKIAAIFALFGLIGTYAGTKLGILTPVTVQLGLFALVMYAAAYKMLKPKLRFNAVGADVVKNTPEITYVIGSLPARIGYLALLGLAVGLLTGMVGVGGGFLIVPALVLLSGLPMKQAIGTSLVVVAVNSGTGFSGYLGVVPIDYTLMATFTAVAIAGSIIGGKISQYVSPDRLKRGFGVFLVIVATYILIKNTLF